MDDVSGLADKSNEFCSFLTVSPKYRYSCIYNFHIVFPQLRNWQMIISQTKIFNIFFSAVQLGNLSKPLTNNCDRETLKYIPKRELWINSLYFQIADRKDYSCLTIDCGKSGPSKYRTEADNNVQHLEADNRYSLIFKIELSDKNSIKERHLPYNQLLSKGNGNVQVKDDNRSNAEQTVKGQVQKMNEMEQKEEKDHDFSFLEEANQNKENVMSRHLKRRTKPYTSSRIKTRNFISNISYTGVKSEDFADNNFMFDTITLLTKNINPFSHERKIAYLKNYLYIMGRMYWKTFLQTHLRER